MKEQSLKYLFGISLLVTSIQAMAQNVEPYCLLTKNLIGVSLQGNLLYKDGTSIQRHVYLDCNHGICEGFIRGRSWQHTRTIKNLRLDYQGQNLAVLKSGLSEFRIDRLTRSFTWIENPYETSGMFQVMCPEVISWTAQ